MIELRDATVTVRSDGGVRTLLQPTTCTLTERRVAVIGANGSGKSTLARLVNGLVLPSTGTVRVDGLDTVRDGAAVRRRVGFVFTDPDAQLVMPTPVEDVALSLRRTVPAAGRDAAARAVLARFGLADHAEVPVHALSGGQKQLLALAGVLAVQPAVLVCDEPRRCWTCAGGPWWTSCSTPLSSSCCWSRTTWRPRHAPTGCWSWTTARWCSTVSPGPPSRPTSC